MQVLHNFRTRFGGEPDLIVISSNLWDISFWTHFQPEVLEQEDLSQHVLESWLQNAAKLFSAVQACHKGLFKYAEVNVLEMCIHFTVFD